MRERVRRGEPDKTVLCEICVRQEGVARVCGQNEVTHHDQKYKEAELAHAFRSGITPEVTGMAPA